MNFSKIAILGPGLLGGSIALAVRRSLPGTQVAIWARREEAVAEVKTAELAALASTELEPVIESASLVVLCVPVGTMPALAQKIAPLLAPGAVVTDVGSVKGPVVSELATILGGRFIGSHPMAGSERSGLAAARADLFDAAVCIVTPGADSHAQTTAAICNFWQLLGGQVQMLPPPEHDEIMARVSHLPHLLAAALVEIAAADHPRALDFSGPGFRDATRIAAGPPPMWAGIFQQNQGALKKSVHAMIEKLRDVLKLLDAGDLDAIEQFLAAAKRRRDALKRNTQ